MNHLFYVSTLLFLCGVVVSLERVSRHRLFEIFPAIVVLYFTVLALSAAGLWKLVPATDGAWDVTRQFLLPAMIFLMVLKSDLRLILRLGRRMLLAFAAATSSIAIGFVVAFFLLRDVLPALGWKALAALCGSWMGGAGNMAAIQVALDVPDTLMGYTLLTDSVLYGLWVMALIAAAPLSHRFDAWTRASNSPVLSADDPAAAAAQEEPAPFGTAELLLLLGIGLGVAVLANIAASRLPVSAFFTATAWTVVLATLAGVAGAVTRLGRIAGSSELSQAMLYYLIAMIASRADIVSLVQAPLFVLAGAIVLCIHGLLMVVLARLFRLDLFTCGIASLANIGGVASAPILAATYSRKLIPIGVLMALLGYVVGTGGGLLVGKFLSLLA
jgi:uncharacterized membrane protein